MEDVRSRLMKCFSTVFPALTSGILANANTTNPAEWDSIASVTLIATLGGFSLLGWVMLLSFFDIKVRHVKEDFAAFVRSIRDGYEPELDMARGFLLFLGFLFQLFIAVFKKT